MKYLSPWEQANSFSSTFCPSEPYTVPFIFVIITLVMQTWAHIQVWDSFLNPLKWILSWMFQTTLMSSVNKCLMLYKLICLNIFQVLLLIIQISFDNTQEGFWQKIKSWIIRLMASNFFYFLYTWNLYIIVHGGFTFQQKLHLWL